VRSRDRAGLHLIVRPLTTMHKPFRGRASKQAQRAKGPQPQGRGGDSERASEVAERGGRERSERVGVTVGANVNELF
jgi:hypothetical protein